jgi:hypothetical protein
MATLWQHAIGMGINMPFGGPALEDFARKLKKCNFSAYMIEAHEGTDIKYTPDEIKKHFEPFRAVGIWCGIWGYLKTNPVVEAELANSLGRQTISIFYVANAEIEYKYTQSGYNCLECFQRSEKFVERYRQLRPTHPLGVSSYGRFDRADLHWATWLNDGSARALPQAYPNEQGASWEVDLCWKGAVDVGQPHNPMYNPRTHEIIPGFPKSYIHCTIPLPDPEDKYVYTIEDYVDQLILARKAGHPLGFSCYEIENYSDRDLEILGSAIKSYNLAAVRAS